MQNNFRWNRALVVTALVGLAGGCAFEGATDGEPGSLGSDSEALVRWLGPISDEANKNVGTCSDVIGVRDLGVVGGQCKGSKCDDNYLECATLPAGVFWSGNSYATRWFSEEGSPFSNWAVCDGGSGATGTPRGVLFGLSARGNFSDDLSLRCKPVNARFSNCFWTPFFSEEQGPQTYFGFAVGMQCRGPNCDDVSYEVCQVDPP